jgi:uncharacterized protein involved in exopolysaccharide biosynthesis
MTSDRARAHAPVDPDHRDLAASDAVQQLRTAYVQLKRAGDLIAEHPGMLPGPEQNQALETLAAARELIIGVGDALNREIARTALGGES